MIRDDIPHLDIYSMNDRTENSRPHQTRNHTSDVHAKTVLRSRTRYIMADHNSLILLN